MYKIFTFKTLILVAIMQVLLITVARSQGYSPLSDQTTCGTNNTWIEYVYSNSNLTNCVGYQENAAGVQVYVTAVTYTLVAHIPEKAKHIYTPFEVLQTLGSSLLIKKQYNQHEQISL
jgi:hypothetical protein